MAENRFKSNQLIMANVPEKLRPFFSDAEHYIRSRFQDKVESPEDGSIVIGGNRYILVRAASMSTEFFDMVNNLYGERGGEKARYVARNLLFDLAHAIGKADAKHFHAQMNVDSPIEKLSAGPAHFAHIGWATVDILEESEPSSDENYYLIYDHPHSFEADEWLSAGRRSDHPVCIMSAGYSSGWCEESFGVALTAHEVSCRAAGHEQCRFIMAPPWKMDEHLSRFWATSGAGRHRVTPSEVPKFFARKHNEEQLRESERRYKDISLSFADWIWEIDADFRYTFASGNVSQILGYTAEEMIGKTPFQFVLEDADSKGVKEHEHSLRLHAKARKPIVDLEVNFATKRGKTVHLLLNALPSTNALGEFLGYRGTSRDITERKQLEWKLQQSQKLEALGNLAGGIAHDMNNILAAIMGLASAIDAETYSTDPRKRDIEGIVAACQKGRDLTRDLLGFVVKDDQAKVELPIGILIGDVERILKHTISKKIKVHLKLGPKPIWIDGDKNQLIHALMNTCLSCADAMNGAGELNITAESIELDEGESFHLDRLPPGKYALVQITHDGTAMDDEEIKRAFEPFSSRRSKAARGGLGLALVYNTVKNHGGTLNLESRPGHGTTIKIYLPGKTKPTKTNGLADGMPFVSPEKGTVLLVDDEELVRSAGRRLLKKLGYDVVFARNGQEAVDVYRERGSSFVLTIMDIRMPVMSGDEAFFKIMEIDPRARVLISTGYSREEQADRLLKNGAAGFLPKPYNLDELAQVLAHCTD